ncbi:hypothetical protein Nepgr_018853 [Nepenthes gracilis]|uniref:Uncharacterized protein n=1 Tax=Nepenthes gracilis TaxID=150966 RepID=A0AAD3SUU9_NEPGR|nr:hypothetical protein Nepgr_018853 [Nepenthes gracilis]
MSLDIIYHSDKGQIVVRIWNINSVGRDFQRDDSVPRLLATLRDHFGSPNGYSLFASSLDGTVGTFYFDIKELGQRLSDDKLDGLKRSRYGDVRGLQTNLAESPAQMLLEAAAAKLLASKKLTSDVQQSQPLSNSSIGLGPPQKLTESQAENGKKSEVVGSDCSNKVGNSAPVSSPVRQKEYRRPDGRKRIIL